MYTFEVLFPNEANYIVSSRRFELLASAVSKAAEYMELCFENNYPVSVRIVKLEKESNRE